MPLSSEDRANIFLDTLGSEKSFLIHPKGKGTGQKRKLEKSDFSITEAETTAEPSEAW